MAAALEKLRSLCLALPGSTEQLSHGAPAFKVAGRMFAYFRHNHHADGKTVVCLKAAGPDEQAMLIEADTALFSWPAYLGKAGWIAMNLAAPTRIGTMSQPGFAAAIASPAEPSVPRTGSAEADPFELYFGE